MDKFQNVLVRLGHCNKYLREAIKGGKIYLGWFQKLQSIGLWQSTAVHPIVARKHREKTPALAGFFHSLVFCLGLEQLRLDVLPIFRVGLPLLVNCLWKCPQTHNPGLSFTNTSLNAVKLTVKINLHRMGMIKFWERKHWEFIQNNWELLIRHCDSQC
jgi:hypothetical protein